MNSKNKKNVIKINEMHKWFGSFNVLKNINLEDIYKKKLPRLNSQNKY